MKKILLLVLFCTLASCMECVAQRGMKVWRDGKYEVVFLSDVDSVTFFEEPSKDMCVMYYGASLGIPEDIESQGHPHEATTGLKIDIETTSKDKCKCHWVALKKDSGFRVIDMTQSGDPIFDLMKSKEIGDYICFYLLSSAFISNKTIFTISM